MVYRKPDGDLIDEEELEHGNKCADCGDFIPDTDPKQKIIFQHVEGTNFKRPESSEKFIVCLDCAKAWGAELK